MLVNKVLVGGLDNLPLSITLVVDRSADMHTRVLTYGAMAKAWCLRVHVEASPFLYLSFSRGSHTRDVIATLSSREPYSKASAMK